MLPLPRRNHIKLTKSQHPDPEWRSRLDAIQASHLRRMDENSSGFQNGFRLYRPLKEKNVLPHAITPRAAEDAVTLEEVGSAWDLAKNLEKMPLPSQLIAVLSDPLLQKLTLLRQDANVEVQQRATKWIQALRGDVISGEVDEAELEALLSVMDVYVTNMKVSPA